MKRLCFNNYEELACDISDKFDSLKLINKNSDISIIGKYHRIKEIFKELIFLEYDICDICLEFPECNNYYDEYILSLNSDKIWIEKFKKDNGYLTDESLVTYILDDCSSNVIKHCKGHTVFEVCIGDDCDDGCECNYDVNVSGECTCCGKTTPEKYIEYSNDDNGDMHGFSASRYDGDSYFGMSFYSTDKLSEKDIQGLLQEHGF